MSLPNAGGAASQDMIDLEGLLNAAAAQSASGSAAPPSAAGRTTAAAETSESGGGGALLATGAVDLVKHPSGIIPTLQ